MAERDPRNRTGRGPLLRGLAAAVLAAGMLVASAGQGQATGPAAAAPEAQFTPLTAAVLTKPTPFAATDVWTPLIVRKAFAAGRLVTKPVTVTELAVVKIPCTGEVIVTVNRWHALGVPLQV